MQILETFSKQAGEIKDFDLSFAKYLTHRTDTARALNPVEAEVPSGVTLMIAMWVEATDSVKLWFDGGVIGKSYPVMIWLHTAAGRRLGGKVVIEITK